MNRQGRGFPLLFPFLLAGWLAACVAAPATPVVAVTSAPPATTATLAPPPATPPPAFTASPAPSPTPACRQTVGTVATHEIDTGVALAPRLRLRLYLPPCYAAGAARYPLLVMLHGQSFDDGQWERLGLLAAADRLIAAGELRPALIVMPYEERWLQSPQQSGFGDALVTALLPWLDRNYSTCTQRQCRAIGGLSRGAAWAVRLGFTHWEQFGAVGAHSLPPFLGDDVRLGGWLKAIPPGQTPRLYLDIGEKDRYRKPAEEFEALLGKYAVPHEWHLGAGQHDEVYWSVHVEEYLRWYAAGW